LAAAKQGFCTAVGVIRKMKIDGFQVSMSASHQVQAREEVHESLAVWIDGQGSKASYTLDLSPEGQASLLAAARSAQPACACNEEQYEEITVSDEDKLKVKLIEAFFESLTGKKLKIKIPVIKIKKPPGAGMAPSSPPSQADGARQGWGLAFDYSREFHEQETATFSVSGTVSTGDGREIAIGLELKMSRDFTEKSGFRIRAGDAARIDPLAVNFRGGMAALTTAKYFFDLDNDGQKDQISFLQNNSGFLAIDLNGDGTINSGQELFGPNTGDGFRELAAYDQDHNCWIDENDPVFHRLRIWTKDSEGRDYLLALGETGIGAIYVGSIATPFALRGPGNKPLGEIRKTGLFLKENGTAGTIQHVDLTV